jgi:hypothetical protein
MPAIKVLIVKYISNDQPGYVECIFRDAWNKEHIVHEKVPIITDKWLDADSNYPQEGVLDCKIIKEYDRNGRKIISVTTATPWGIETVEGIEKFDILEEILVKD